MSDIIENGQLSQKQRIDLVKSFLMESDIELISETEMPNSFHGFSVRIIGKELKLSILTKNIVNSGWVEKPYIKRIQVTSFIGKQIEKNVDGSCSLFLGIAFANSKPIFIVWNPFLFVFHKTNRSCYVNVESIARCYHLGFLKTNDAKKEVYLCDSKHFCDLIKKFVEDNSVELL